MQQLPRALPPRPPIIVTPCACAFTPNLPVHMLGTLPALADEEEAEARKAREAEKRKAKKERQKAKKTAAKGAEQPGAQAALILSQLGPPARGCLHSGWAVLSGWPAAVVDVWPQQVAHALSCIPHPTPPAHALQRRRKTMARAPPPRQLRQRRSQRPRLLQLSPALGAPWMRRAPLHLPRPMPPCWRRRPRSQPPPSCLKSSRRS